MQLQVFLGFSRAVQHPDEAMAELEPIERRLNEIDDEINKAQIRMNERGAELDRRLFDRVEKETDLGSAAADRARKYEMHRQADKKYRALVETVEKLEAEKRDLQTDKTLHRQRMRVAEAYLIDQQRIMRLMDLGILPDELVEVEKERATKELKTYVDAVIRGEVEAFAERLVEATNGN